MFMGQDNPIAASASGGVYNYKDGRHRTRHHQRAAGIPVAVHGHVRSHAGSRHHRGPVELCGTEGRLWLDRSRYEFHPIGRNAQPTVVQASSDLDLDHVENFLECVRSRKLPNGDVLIGHRSAQASHLGISRTCKRGASISTRSAKRFCRSDGLLY